jgi:hypothetical protein
MNGLHLALTQLPMTYSCEDESKKELYRAKPRNMVGLEERIGLTNILVFEKYALNYHTTCSFSFVHYVI